MSTSFEIFEKEKNDATKSKKMIIKLTLFTSLTLIFQIELDIEKAPTSL